MLVTPTARKRNTRLAAAGLATAVAFTGAAFGLVAPANAAVDAWDTKSAPQNASVSISKTDPDDNPLDGAIFEVAVYSSGRIFTGAFGAYVNVDTATFGYGDAAGIEPLTWEQYRDAEVARHNAAISPEIAAEHAELTAYIASIDIAAERAAYDAHQAQVAALQPLRDEASAAQAALDVLVTDWDALQAIPAAERTPEQQGRIAVLMTLIADAQSARDDANAAVAAVTGTPEYLAIQEAGNTAAATIAQYDAAVARLAALPDVTPWTADSNGVDRAAFDAGMAAFSATNDTRVARDTAQAECNARFGLSNDPIRTETIGGRAAQIFQVATCGGTSAFLLNGTPLQVTEIAAPEGFVLDGTVRPVTQVSEVHISFEGTRYSLYDSALPITNEPEEPVEPPVEPPVTPDEPAKPVEQPKAETLAYTGSDASPIGFLAAAAGLIAAGAGAIALRRRRDA